MKQKPITKAQLSKLQLCWNLYAVEDCGRDARLRWASRNVGREITSFSDLTRAEAVSLIDVLQVGLELVP